METYSEGLVVMFDMWDKVVGLVFGIMILAGIGVSTLMIILVWGYFW